MSDLSHRIQAVERRVDEHDEALEGTQATLDRLAELVERLETARETDERERERAQIRREERERAREELGLPPIGTSTPPVTLPGVRTESAWASTIREALDLVASRGGLAVLIALTTAFTGPRVAAVLETLAETLAADVAVDVAPPAVYVPIGEDDSPTPPQPTP